MENKNCLIKRSLLFGMLLVIVLGTSGCFQMIGASMHNSAVKKFPTYDDTKAAWGPIPPDHGRIVIFYPRIAMGGVMPGGIGGAGVGIKIDNIRGGLIDQTFVFIDMPAGKHVLSYTGGIIFGPDPTEFNIVPGEVTYLRALGKTNPMDIKEAETLLADIYHYYRLPLPYDKQDKKAERVNW